MAMVDKWAAGDILVCHICGEPMRVFEIVVLKHDKVNGILEFAQPHSIAWTQVTALEIGSDMIYFGSRYAAVDRVKKGAALELVA
jgi:hypothetical protein